MLLLVVHAMTAAMLTGLIWLVQVVQYPLFVRVGREGFARYHAGHTELISYVVIPLMFIELGTGVLLVLRPALFAVPAELPRWLPWVGLGLLGLVWATTFAHSVPRHGQLAQGFDAAAHAQLVAGNWLRTLGWSARTALWAYALLSLYPR